MFNPFGVETGVRKMSNFELNFVKKNPSISHCIIDIAQSNLSTELEKNGMIFMRLIVYIFIIPG